MSDLEGEYAVTQPPVETPIRKAINRAKEYLAKGDPWTAIGMLYGMPEVKCAGLEKLVWLLDKNEYGCSRADVIGVIELLELYLSTIRDGDTCEGEDPISP